MSERQAHLVIQISGPEGSTGANGQNSAGRNSLASEFRRCLEPGVEIALTCDRYVAIGSIVWVTDSPQAPSFHAGVRLLAISNLPTLAGTGKP